MRIALLTTQVPFVRGGAELLAENLEAELRKAGHDTAIVSIPFNWHPSEKLAESMLMGRMIDVSSVNGVKTDLTIGLKFPAYLAEHDARSFWIVHQHRQAYDMWDAGTSDLNHLEDGALMRAAIMRADKAALRGEDVYTISSNVSERLERYNGIASRPIYHPPPLAPLLRAEAAEDYVLVPSRIGPAKRQDLILEALARTRHPVHAVFVGRPDDPAYGEALRARTEALGLSSRVTWAGGVDGARLATYYARARAVVFAPRDEDYGYVTLEAMLAGKPVLTCHDSGGPLEFVIDQTTGLAAPPSVKGLADGLDALWGDPAEAAAMGEAGLARYHEMEVGWDKVLSHLLKQAPMAEAPPVAAPVQPSEKAPEEDAAEEASAPETAPAAPPAASVPDVLEVDVEAILAGLPVANLTETLEAFDFSAITSEETGGYTAHYLEGHWLRYLMTAHLVPREGGLRVLDLGSGRPWTFPALVKLIDPKARISAVVESAFEAGRTETYASRTGGPALEIETASLNLETETYPYPDDTFDCVLAMEVVEHLALNPVHLFAEAARVLRPGGQLIVTTPNVASYRALSLLHRGEAPYSFGTFVPYHGVYGRHNREYTPHEIELLGRMAGLQTDALLTKDVFLNERWDYPADLVGTSDYPVALRGQNIFYVGRKAGEPFQIGQTSLYMDDPFAYVGRLTPAREADAGLLHLTCANGGRRAWTSDDTAEDRVLMRLDIVHDPHGTTGRWREFHLPETVPPGETRELTLPIAPMPGAATALGRLHLMRVNHGSLNAIGIPGIDVVVSADALARLDAAGIGATGRGDAAA